MLSLSTDQKLNKKRKVLLKILINKITGEVEPNTSSGIQYVKTGFNFIPHSCFNMILDDKTTKIKKRQYLDINKICQVLLRSYFDLEYKKSKSSKFVNDFKLQ